tara:strand:- start:1211 stop:1720 length:510 start_codon:yes stop_codon:yes gene_type:complete
MIKSRSQLNDTRDFTDVIDSISTCGSHRVELLTDLGAAGSMRAPLTAHDNNKTFLVPELTSGAQNVFLPAPSSELLGWSVRFITTDAADQVFTLETDITATKIVASKPKGDGDNTAAASTTYNSIGFKAAAIIGTSFRVTLISTTAAHAWFASDVVEGLAANVGGIDLA